MEATQPSEVGDDELQRQHFIQVLKTFRSYRSCALRQWAQSVEQYDRISDRQKELIPDHPSYLNALKENIKENHKVIKMVTEASENIFENKKDLYNDVLTKTDGEKSSWLDIDKVYSTLKQVVREWGVEGREERDLSYAVVINEIIYLFSHRERKDVCILVPGSGLGRLAYDLAQLGFSCEGNEYSLFMIIMSNFITNKCLHLDHHRIYPWLHDSTNCLSHSDQLRHSTFPDTKASPIYAHHIHSNVNYSNSPSKTTLSSSNLSPTRSIKCESNRSEKSSHLHNSAPSTEQNAIPSHPLVTLSPSLQSSSSLSPLSPSSSPRSPSSPFPSLFNHFSIIAGDFLEVYKKPASWDCIATVFFLDTGHNILSYIENIYRILKPGGYLVNFGPLLYHFANTDDSLQLSYDQVKIAIQKIGFNLIKEEKNMPCTYNHNPPSMLTQQYHCVFFVAQKPYQPQNTQ